MKDDKELEFNDLLNQLPLDDAPDPEQQAELKERLLDLHRGRAEVRTKTRTQRLGRLLMKYKIPHLTTLAASVSIVVFFLQFTTPAFAIDKAIQQIIGAKSATYDLIILVEGTEVKRKVSLSGPFSREEDDSSVTVFDNKQNRLLLLNKQLRQATLTNIDTRSLNGGKEVSQNQATNIFETLKSLLEYREDDVQPLGTKTFDGQELVGYAIPSSDIVINLWSDSRSNAPVRIEFSLPNLQADLVMENYQANVDLDPELFSFEVPDGYKLSTTNVGALSLPKEEDLLKTFRLCLEKTGKFPPGLGTASMSESVAEFAQQLLPEDVDAINVEQIQQQTIEYSSGFTFAMTLSKKNEAFYAGKEANQEKVVPVFWYRPTKADSLSVSESFRVIYSDLTVRESGQAPVVKDAVAVGIFAN